MLIRVRHDVSGFVIYNGQDVSRNRGERENMLYRAVPLLQVWSLTHMYAVVIADGLAYLANRDALSGVRRSR